MNASTKSKGQESGTVPTKTFTVEVPSTCVPFAVGFVLYDDQLCRLAKQRLSEETFKRATSKGGYYAAICEHLRHSKARQVMLQCEDGNGEQYYLWAFSVFPSLNGNAPRFQWDVQKAAETLRLENASDFVSPTVESVRWPDDIPRPGWVIEEFYIRIWSLMETRYKEKMEEKKKSGPREEVQV